MSLPTTNEEYDEQKKFQFPIIQCLWHFPQRVKLKYNSVKSTILVILGLLQSAKPVSFGKETNIAKRILGCCQRRLHQALLIKHIPETT